MIKTLFELVLKLEEISLHQSRLKITELLSRIFQELCASDAQLVSYLLLGEIAPAYQGIRFNLADKQLKVAVSLFLQQNFSELVVDFENNFLSFGDLGLALFKTLPDKGFESKQILLNDFFDRLLKIAKTTGNGSVDEKMLQIKNLLEEMHPLEQKYFLKIISGKLRLGFSTMGLLAAFAASYSNSREVKDLLEKNYNVCADVGKIIYKLKTFGIDSLLNSEPEPGVPVCTAAAERVADLQELIARQKDFVLQPKLDGLRVQIHKFQQKNQTSVKIFSRNLLDITEMFPEIQMSIINHPMKDFILDGEAIGVNEQSGQNLDFQSTIKRRRKHDISDLSQKIPIKIFVFDVLFASGKSLLSSPYLTRRRELEEIFEQPMPEFELIKEVSSTFLADDSEKVDFVRLYFEDCLNQGFEGILAKTTQGLYQAGKRGFNWIKIKQLETSRLGDSIDCIVLGYYLGQGRRAAIGLGALLVGILNQEKTFFQSLAKVGSGLSDQISKLLLQDMQNIILEKKPDNYDVHSNLNPDFWVSPKIIVEVEADEITKSPLHSAAKGLALRFPRLKKVRPDKNLSDATSESELVKVFNNQTKNQQ